jgi:hypothetical protein
MAINDFNFNTKNIIIFQYPPFAGGKFVMNCLGLSDNMVLQSQSLAQAQIDGNFSFDDKKEYILTHMQTEDILKNNFWGDLKLGCFQLFGLTHFSRQQDWIGDKQRSLITDTAKFLSSENNNKLLFSLVWHSLAVPSMFPNAKIITFKNNEQMINHRTSFLKGKTSPYREDEREAERRENNWATFFTWDTEWLYDVSTTTDGLHELYKLFNLDGWEQAEPFIKEYYHLWREKNHLPQ